MYNSKNRIKDAREHSKKVREAMNRRMIKSYDPVLKSIYDVDKNKKEKK